MSCNRERPITSCKITFGTRPNCSRHLAAAIGGEENNQKQSDDHGHSVKKLISQSFVCFLLITELASRVTAGSHTHYICKSADSTTGSWKTVRCRYLKPANAVLSPRTPSHVLDSQRKAKHRFVTMFVCKTNVLFFFSAKWRNIRCCAHWILTAAPLWVDAQHISLFLNFYLFSEDFLIYWMFMNPFFFQVHSLYVLTVALWIAVHITVTNNALEHIPREHIKLEIWADWEQKKFEGSSF